MTVDHREPRSRRPDLALAPSNLQTLCSRCHGQAKQHHERTAGDVMAGGSSAAGWPVDPGHPWNLAASAPPGARLAPKPPAPAPSGPPRGNKPGDLKNRPSNADSRFFANRKGI
jgi:hypothetical protein